MKARLLASKPAQLAAAALAALSAVPLIGHVVAPDVAAECNPYDPNSRINNATQYTNGWARGASGFNVPIKTKANFEVRDVWVTPKAGPVSQSTVVLQRFDATKFAQIGWVELAGNVRNTLIQYWRPNAGTPTTVLQAPQPVGSSPNYRVEHIPGSEPVISFYVNSNNVFFDATAFLPEQARQMSAITTASTQMPGGYNEPERFTNAQIWYIGDGVWADFVGDTFNPKPDWFGNSKLSATELHIWDDACAT